MAWHRRFAALVAAVVLLGIDLGPAPTPAGAQPDDFPIFDTHLHFSQDAWGLFTAQEILGLMDQAGVYRALVSSTPDDGTLQLYQLAPDRIIPILRPYRTRADMTTWTRDGSVVAYVEERLEKGVYRGIGEFHLGIGESSSLAPRRFADLSAELDLYLHAHTDATGVAELLALRSDARVLWAHAGMGASPATIDALLARSPHLWVELALRTDVAPGGRLDPEWAALFARYPDRFMIGTDTWIPSRWPQLPRLMADVRTWLRQLPRDLAERIASGNAEALFNR
jgi:Amidohydrolase